MKRTIACAFLVLVGLSALGSSSSNADTLDDGAAICKQHENPPMITAGVPVTQQSSNPTFDKTWEHCAEIMRQWAQRKLATDAADESKNTDLKMTRDLYKSITGATQ